MTGKDETITDGANIYVAGTTLFAGWEFSQAVEWARSMGFTQEDVKIIKRDWQVLVVAVREVGV